MRNSKTILLRISVALGILIFFPGSAVQAINDTHSNMQGKAYNYYNDKKDDLNSSASVLSKMDIIVEPTPNPTLTPNPTPNSTLTPTATPISTGIPKTSVLYVDNQHIYEGMDRSYEQGYIPQIAEGKAKVVLPLVLDGGALKDELNITFDFGDPGSSPFVFQNYNKTIKLQQNTVVGSSEKVEAYLLTVDLTLFESRVNGSYPVVVNVEWLTKDNISYKEEFTIFVTILDGIDPNLTPTPAPTETPPAEEQPISTPRIMISKTIINPTEVEAGDEFTLSVTLQNTHSEQDLTNIKVTVTSADSDVLIGYDCSSFYIGRISSKEEAVIEIKAKAEKNTLPGTKEVLLEIEYDGAKAVPYSSSESIKFSLVQPLRLVYDNPVIPDTVNAGDTFSVAMNIMNLGLSTLHNVSVSLEADGLIPDSTLFMGNIESGASKTDDIYVFAGRLTQGKNENNENAEYGKTSGKIIIIYEDEFGQVYREECPFSCTIEPLVVAVPTESAAESDSKPETQWGISVALGAVILVIISVFLVIKYRKKSHVRSEYGDDT